MHSLFGQLDPAAQQGVASSNCQTVTNAVVQIEFQLASVRANCNDEFSFSAVFCLSDENET